MDPISILGTAIGVATLAAEVSKSLFRAADAISKSQEEARDLTDQLCSLTSILTTIKTIVEEKRELFNEMLYRNLQEITMRIEGIAEKVKRMVRSRSNRLRLAFRLDRVKPLLNSIKAMESSLQTILITMLVAKEQVKAPNERPKAHAQQKYANQYRLLAESRVENDRQVIQRLAFEAAIIQRRYRDNRSVHHHLRGQHDTATWLYHLVFTPGFPQAPVVPNSQSGLRTPTVRTVGTINTDDALQEAQNYQTATFVRGSESADRATMPTVPERRGSTTTQRSTSRRSTVSSDHTEEQHSQIVATSSGEEANGDWESEDSEADSDDDAGNLPVLWNPRQRYLAGITDSATATVDNLLHKFTNLTARQIQATSELASREPPADATLEHNERRSATPHGLVEGSPQSHPASTSTSLLTHSESESEGEQPGRGRRPPSRSPTRDRRRHEGPDTYSNHYPRHHRHHMDERSAQPSPQVVPEQRRNQSYHPQPFRSSGFQAPESNPFHPSYHGPFNSPQTVPSYTAPPTWHPQFAQPIPPFGPSNRSPPVPRPRRYRSLSPYLSAETRSQPPALPTRETTAEEKLRVIEQQKHNERLANLESIVQETREKQLQEEARENAVAAKEESYGRQQRDLQIQTSLTELISRKREDEAKRAHEQLLAALEAKREEAELKATAERERYLKLEREHKEDVDRRVAEALSQTKAVLEKDMAELKSMAKEATASARAATKSKKLAEVESAKRASDAARKTSEAEKERLVEDHKEALSYLRERLMEVEQAKTAAEALLFEQKATPARQLRLKDGERRMELVETQHGLREPMANTEFLASAFFHHRTSPGFLKKPRRLNARLRTEGPIKEVPSLSSEESEEDRRVRENALLSGKPVVLLPSAENTSEAEMLEIRTAISESGLSAANSLVPFKGRRAHKDKGITATFQWNSPLPTESRLLPTLKGNGWKPVYRRRNGDYPELVARDNRADTSTELGQTWFIGHDPVHIDFFTPQYKPQIHPTRVKRKITEGNVVIGSEWIDEDIIKYTTKFKYDLADGFYLFRPNLSVEDIDTLISRTLLQRENDLHKAFHVDNEDPSDEESQSSAGDSDTHGSKEDESFSFKDSGYQDWEGMWNTQEQEHPVYPFDPVIKDKLVSNFSAAIISEQFIEGAAELETACKRIGFSVSQDVRRLPALGWCSRST
ncbi:hypothetical protein MPH_01511 [Macrophomina phaseolina MS6]|uniref:Azaphilone pigments biosynthesis cluster protein L N-terminal domain-containing protein n=1 Tax=Macrophomina phaseolina (strain MS6) TaxID=1126212 RepID=K2SX81_MACPH|nr:hypothetical protein MPH_01511 [Macrophomina phaseolina MS6]